MRCDTSMHLCCLERKPAHLHCVAPAPAHRHQFRLQMPTLAKREARRRCVIGGTSMGRCAAASAPRTAGTPEASLPSGSDCVPVGPLRTSAQTHGTSSRSKGACERERLLAAAVANASARVGGGPSLQQQGGRVGTYRSAASCASCSTFASGRGLPQSAELLAPSRTPDSRDTEAPETGGRSQTAPRRRRRPRRRWPAAAAAPAAPAPACPWCSVRTAGFRVESRWLHTHFS